MIYLGRVLDGYGRDVGHGIELDASGAMVRLLSNSEAQAASGDDVRRAHLITPGLVDIHCHGGGGFAFPDNYKPEQIAAAIRTHQLAGTTAMFASLVSLADPSPQLEALIAFCEDGQLAGIHMEGPYVSRQKCGAQNPAVVRDVDEEELLGWLKIGRGWIKTMTIAPEAPGARRAAELLLEHGGKPSWGHSHDDGTATRQELDYTYEAAEKYNRVVGQATQTVTHLFNAMTGFSHRAPGPIRVYIQAAKAGKASAELIADGYHVHPDLVEDIVGYLDGAASQLGIPGAFFVTDSLAAAGMPEGKYTLGGLPVEVRTGACYLEGTQTLAGGATTLADQIALFAKRGKLTLGQLVRATVAGPVYAAGIWDAQGVTVEFKPGEPVNLVAWGENMTPTWVIREGGELNRG
ncbi:amidohydrolase family protein [Propionimicrobium lymphophilum]|uniref:N-acetylglucosamine-6-phosphate deacetylase n=1 Tax=Propionimicrobium TaxID=203133 RepID=UPI0003D79AE6|nr:MULTISPECIES: amidohydrolase family protein [Propionimicrobium]ETJ96787.1 amidohydrolase domain protein [Propionimicrobium sp. BV2F7]MDK7709474.1 amidohydrolase family protein [Propionimicrobium lymphophilum]MDK7733460.1 amidohydrolase family protein [Propionimicrobium lymphophilum]